MKWWMARWVAVAGVFSWLGVAQAAESPHQIGVGAHYWHTLDNIDVDEVDEDGVSWIASYQYKPGYLGLGLDLEWKEEGIAGSPESVYEPQDYLILGKDLYGAAGIGGYYFDGDFAEDPFYFFRAGVDLEVVPSLHLDIHAVYRFEKWDDVNADESDIDTDTVTLGAALRLGF